MIRLTDHFRPSCRLTVSMVFIMFCLLIPHQVWAGDWSKSVTEGKISITQKLSATCQHIAIRYPIVNDSGIKSDGAWNSSIKVNGYEVFHSVGPWDAPDKVGAGDWACYYTQSTAKESDDGWYRVVYIRMKTTTTWDEYCGFSVSLSFDYMCDKTHASDNADQKNSYNVTKNYSFSDLSSQSLQLPSSLAISYITYGSTQSTVQIRPSSLSNGWTSQVSYYTDAQTNVRRATPQSDVRLATVEGMNRHEAGHNIHLYAQAERTFTFNGTTFTRTLRSNGVTMSSPLHARKFGIAFGDRTTGKFTALMQATGIDGVFLAEFHDYDTGATTQSNVTITSLEQQSDSQQLSLSLSPAPNVTNGYLDIYYRHFGSTQAVDQQSMHLDIGLKMSADGYYEIPDASSLVNFLSHTSDDANPYAKNARLMADIDMSGKNMSNIQLYFAGIFDGQCHIIKNLHATYGLFCSIEGTVKDLGIINSEFTDQCAGAFASKMEHATIERCFAYNNNMSYETKDYAGAIVSRVESNSRISNCWSAVAGVDINSTGGGTYTIEHCHALSGPDDPTLASGAFCWTINDENTNGTWRQTLGSDPYPVLDTTHARVSKTTPCISYNNTGTTSLEHQIEVVETIPATCIDHGHAVSECTRCHTAETRTTYDLDLPFGDHQYVDGICQVCNAIAPEAPLCFTAQENNVEITLNKKGTPAPVSLSYSTDGITWSSYTIGTSISLNQGNKLFMRATDKNATFSKDLSNNYQFKIDGKVAASGSCNTLLDKEGTYSVPTWAFVKLLRCENLTAAPALPATTLAEHCYEDMFNGCTSLTTAPELPATTLAKDCYSGMFVGCSSLTTAPELPATTMVEECYNGMFTGCSSLTTAPELPATTLAESCYYHMFVRCTSLTTAPELPATTLAESCYYSMFAECTSLTNAPELPATTLEELCYAYMFNGCTSLTTGPALPATTLTNGCYTYMFDGCTKLNQIEVSFTEWRRDITATDCWLDNASSTGTFVCPQALIQNTTTRDVNTVPEGWTFQSNNDAFFASETSTLAKIISSGQHTTQQLTRYDLNKDSKITIIDLTKLVEKLKNEIKK